MGKGKEKIHGYHDHLRLIVSSSLVEDGCPPHPSGYNTSWCPFLDIESTGTQQESDMRKTVYGPIPSTTEGLSPHMFLIARNQNLSSMRIGKQKIPIFRLKETREMLASYLKSKGAIRPQWNGLAIRKHPIEMQTVEEKVKAGLTIEPPAILSTVSRILSP